MVHKLATQIGAQCHTTTVQCCISWQHVHFVIFGGSWTYSIAQIGTHSLILSFKMVLNMKEGTNLFNFSYSKLSQSTHNHTKTQHKNQSSKIN